MIVPSRSPKLGERDEPWEIVRGAAIDPKEEKNAESRLTDDGKNRSERDK